MKNTIILLFVTLFFISCGESSNNEKKKENNKIESTEEIGDVEMIENESSIEESDFEGESITDYYQGQLDIYCECLSKQSDDRRLLDDECFQIGRQIVDFYKKNRTNKEMSDDEKSQMEKIVKELEECYDKKYPSLGG